MTPPQPSDDRPGLLSRLFGARDEGDGAADPSAPRPVMGLARLHQLRVQDVSIPTAEITAVEAAISLPDLVETFRDSGLTRLPVYDDTIDTPVGLVHLKDFALRHGFGSSEAFEMRAILRPLLYVPPSMTLAVLLSKMQADRIHMALVIDEYGGTDGLVTIEDLVEQVVGEIEDEHDVDEDANWTPEGGGAWIVQARAPLEEFEEVANRSLTDHDDLDAEEIDTIGGLVVMLAGHVPARGEIIPHPAGPEFEVLDADPRRVKRLRVRLSGAAPAQSPGAPSVPGPGAAQSPGAAPAAARPAADPRTAPDGG
ncbi:MAG: transporter associated domain-containing protein [Paracoccaceae bacterium]